MSNSMLISFAFDFALAILLITTIFYCARLSRRVKVLQDSRGELAEMIQQFDKATGRALASVSDLQTVSKKITDALQLKIEKANFLADDLAFLIEKSNKIANQLEQAREEYKHLESRVTHQPARPQHADILHMLSAQQTPPVSDPFSLSHSQEEKLVPRTSAERELLAALKGR